MLARARPHSAAGHCATGGCADPLPSSAADLAVLAQLQRRAVAGVAR
jgi:hypothetical protein